MITKIIPAIVKPRKASSEARRWRDRVAGFFSAMVSASGMAGLLELTKEVSFERKHRTVGSFIEAISYDTLALSVPHRLQADAKPLPNALRAGGLAVAQLEFHRLRRGHDDQRNVKLTFS